MMNLEKMKQKKSKNSVKKGLLAATTILCLTSPMLQTQSVLAAENTAPAITIETVSYTHLKYWKFYRKPSSH